MGFGPSDRVGLESCAPTAGTQPQATPTARGSSKLNSWRKWLAVLGGITAVAVLLNELYYPYNKDVSQFIWDYIADPLALIVIGANILVNVGDSLRIRSKAGNHLAQWPRDVVTGLVAVIWVRFLMQYADKIAPDHHGRIVGAPDRPGNRNPGL